MMSTRASHNEKARIAESYNALYAQFCSDELKEVGNYTIQRLIGEGAFGKVYLAVHRLTHTKVVLKTGAKSDPNLVREVFYHRQFKHPHITRLYEVIVSSERIWLVLEWCPGRELYDYVVRSGRVALDECAKFFAQICSSVHYAHTLNCIHRDLKLENILLDKNRNAKLSDFGFTRECDQRSLLETVCGTTVYMAPELLRKQKYDGFKIDIWSLGVILYTMVYGQMPFDEEDEVRTQFMIINEEPIYKDGPPQDVISLIKRLLNKDPSMRPSTEEILLDPFLDPLGVSLLESSNALVRGLVSQKYFATKSEKRLIKKLKSLGVDVHALQKSVINGNCDSLSGLWEILLEKEKKKEAKKYKTRSRSVLRITESTSRRMSQLMEPISTPQLSRVVSRISTASNQQSASAAAAATSATSATTTLQPFTPVNTDYDMHSINDNHSSLTSSPEKKQNFIQKFAKFWKINKRDEPLNSEISPRGHGTRRATMSDLPPMEPQSLPLAQNNNNNNNNNNTIKISLPKAKAPFKQSQRQHQQSPQTFKQPEEQTTPTKLTIHEGPTSLPRSANGSLRRNSRPRPVSMLSQHSVASQFTTMSDVSLASEQTNQSYDTRPPFRRKLSSEASLKTTRRSLSLISSNSSASDRSSRKGSIYDTSTSSLFRVQQLSARGRRQNDSVFPKSFNRRRKSPMGHVTVGSSKFKRTKAPVIVEQEEDGEDDDDEEEEIEGLEIDMDNMGIGESTRKSSDFEDMDDGNERGRTM